MMTLSQLVRGARGTGVGRAEAYEIVKRYSKALGYEGAAVKLGGEWFFQSPVGKLPLSVVVEDLYDFGEV